MGKLRGVSPDRVAEHFVQYLFEEYRGSRHVRRVAAWVGLILLGIRKLRVRDWWVPRQRQLEFAYKGARFKGRYNHKAGGRRGGGIEIVHVLPGRGSPEGRPVAVMTTLEEAEKFYRRAPAVFKRFVRKVGPGRLRIGEKEG